MRLREPDRRSIKCALILVAALIALMILTQARAAEPYHHRPWQFHIIAKWPDGQFVRGTSREAYETRPLCEAVLQQVVEGLAAGGVKVLAKRCAAAGIAA